MASSSSARAFIDRVGKALSLRSGLVTGVWLTLLLLSPIGGAKAISGQSPDTTKHFNEGQELFARHKYGKAAKELKKAISDRDWSKKQLSEISLLIGRAYIEDGKLKPALEYVEKSIDYDNTALGHYYLAEIELWSGRTLRAADEVRSALSLDPKLAAAYSLMGDIQIVLSGRTHSGWPSNIGPALDSYKQALELSSPNQNGFAQLRDTVAAIEDYLASKDRSKQPGFVPPKPLNRPRPSYSDAARNAKVQGIVRVIAQVLESGKVSKVILVSRLGYGLDQEAVAAVRRLKFSPATVDGKPVSHWVFLEIEFNLRL